MKRRIMKKSEVLREGYIQGLKKAQRIINEMIDAGEAQGRCINTKELKIAVCSHIYNTRSTSAWERGVREYAKELVYDLCDNYEGTEICSTEQLKELLLNGARDWKQFSYGGCSLAYDEEIARRLCNPSELRRTRNGIRKPNSRETWLDVQRRALCQAEDFIMRVFNHETGRDE